MIAVLDKGRTSLETRKNVASTMTVSSLGFILFILQFICSLDSSLYTILPLLCASTMALMIILAWQGEHAFEIREPIDEDAEQREKEQRAALLAMRLAELEMCVGITSVHVYVCEIYAFIYKFICAFVGIYISHIYMNAYRYTFLYKSVRVHLYLCMDMYLSS